ncbi:hypothetical protein ACFXG4_04010 [Nocardia sp. NPDC059246]
MAALPDDFVPENSDLMTPEEEYELIQILESLTDDDLIEAPRPGGEGEAQ